MKYPGKARGRDTRTFFAGEGKKRFGAAAWHTYCIAALKIRQKNPCMAPWKVLESQCPGEIRM
jgi:hypothetical protein